MVISGTSVGYPSIPQGMGAGQARAAHSAGAGVKELGPADQRKVEELKRRDTEVKAHEAAHMAASGGLVRGGASFEYEQGPDGKRYAVGGEVSIDSSPIHGDPQATISKADRIRRAALAPADPSSQDRRVAAQAGQMAAEARMELAKESSEDDGQGSLNSADKLKHYSDIERNSEEQPRLLDLLL